MEPARPIGTVENVSGTNDSAVPTGLETSLVTHNPSSELLGYYQTSLRDERLVCNNEGVFTRG